MPDGCERIAQGEGHHTVSWSWQWTERTLFLTSCPGSGTGRERPDRCRHPPLSRSFSLKEKNKGRMRTPPAASSRRSAAAEVAPHRSAKKEALKLLLTRTQGQKFLELLPTWIKEAQKEKGVCHQMWVILNPGPHSDPLESLTTSGSEGGSCPAAWQHKPFALFKVPKCLAWAFRWSKNITALGQGHGTLLHLSKGCPLFSS